MKKRWIIIVGLIVVIAGGAAAWFFSRDSVHNFTTSPELRARAAALTNADLTLAAFRDAEPARRTVLMQERLGLMQTVGSNTALVVWEQEKLPAQGARKR